MLPLLVAGLLAAGLLLHVAGRADHAAWVWMAGTGVVLLVLSFEIVADLSKGEFGLDVIAALAMVGALALGESLAGIVVALMYSGGEGLEAFAQGRARREMAALVARAPRTATRYRGDRIEEVPIGKIAAGDRLLMRRGDVLPVDGFVDRLPATLDESALTGEPLPVLHEVGASVMSGTTNAGDPFDLVAGGSAEHGTYAGIVRLVETAQASKAPMARLADRYAVGFLAVTLLATAVAWLISGSAERALAVLVVATPCPLILAVPVAIIAGVSRCARHGILVKGGAALERLADVSTMILDKTGTVTDGHPRLLETRSFGRHATSDILRLAASLDQHSQHIVAQSIVQAAREQGHVLGLPQDVHETPGAGLSGVVEGHQVDLGGFEFVRSRIGRNVVAEEALAGSNLAGVLTVLVAVDGETVGVILLRDQVRADAGTMITRLRAAGVRRVLLVTGDRNDVAESVAADLGVDAVLSEMEPAAKTRIVDQERASGPVLMVGDGVNDAPALAAADVGIAMGARGAAAASETADVVILVERLDRVVSAVRIARRSRRIALESVYAGMALSAVGMLAAGLGYLPPVEGAIAQEAIDVAVILNALRALGRPLRELFSKRGLPSTEVALLESEHIALTDILDEIHSLADAIPTLRPSDLTDRLARLEGMVHRRLLPHENRDDEEIYPRLSAAGAKDALIGMSRTHTEIKRSIKTLSQMRQSLANVELTVAVRREVQRHLDGLEAVLRLHFAQEEEIYRAYERE